MNNSELTTLEKIKKEGKKEFFEKGYKDASLRNIVKRAGVTTGAFYGYYPDKAALFKALVTPAAENFKALYLKSLRGYDDLPEERKIAEMHTYTVDGFRQMIEYLYSHYDSFKLIICCADGTEYQYYIDSLVDMEVESTIKLIQLLEKHGYPVRKINPDLCHMLASAYFNGIFETIAHDMSMEEAIKHITVMTEFFSAGWDKIFGLI